MRSQRILAAVAVLVLPFLGCDSGTGTGVLEPQVTTGVWSGRTLPALGSGTTVPTTGTNSDSVRLALSEQADGSISGSATVTQNAATTVYTVDGQNFFPQVELTLDPGTAAGAGTLIEMRGEFATNESIRLQIFGGGFDGERVLLERRPSGL